MKIKEDQLNKIKEQQETLNNLLNKIGVLETNKHPGELKDMVATPGGTTITAIHELESAKLRATLIRAVEAAAIKSKSLNSSK